VNDISLNDYLAVTAAKHATFLPHSVGRYSKKRFRKAQCAIVERLTNLLMMHGRNNGKKVMAVYTYVAYNNSKIWKQNNCPILG
jgi:small subunit ribosomal protein S5e